MLRARPPSCAVYAISRYVSAVIAPRIRPARNFVESKHREGGEYRKRPPLTSSSETLLEGGDFVSKVSSIQVLPPGVVIILRK